MATKINDASALTSGLVWALLTYEDGSQFCFQTTLNQRILAQHSITLEEEKLPRLDKKYLVNGEKIYRHFRYKDAKVSLWDEMHYTDKESEALKDFM